MERFSNFGAPLVEGFQSPVFAQIDDEDCDDSGRCAIIKKYSANEKAVEDEDDDEVEDIFENEENQADIEDAKNNPVPTSMSSSPTTLVANDEDDGLGDEPVEGDESVEDDDQDVDDPNDDDGSFDDEQDKQDFQEESTTTTTIEGFAGSNLTLDKLMNFNLLLKSILFACLFYILAHPQTRSFITRNLFKKMKKSQYLYVAMVIYVVVFYVLNLVV